MVGFLRLSRVFGPVFLLCGSLPWIWPGWATGAGTILSWQLGGEPVAWAIGGLVLCGLVLSLGPVVYRTVETLMFVLVTLIFAALVVLAVLVVRPDAIGELLAGAVRVGHVPEGIELPLLLGALAFAGAGGTLNLAQSNYVRDKGYGMGRWVGRITSPLTGREEAAGVVGYAFADTPESRARWRWWRRTNLEHGLTFFLLCLVSITLLALIAHSLLEPGAPVAEGFGFIADQGHALEERFGPAARHAFLYAGIAVLFSTELVLLDAVSRVLTDLLHTMFFHGQQGWSPSRLYFTLLWILIAFGALVLLLGLNQPLTLLVLSASLNAVVMFVYSGTLLWLGLASFRGPLRPGPVRIAALGVSLAFFGTFSFLTLRDQLARLL